MAFDAIFSDVVTMMTSFVIPALQRAYRADVFRIRHISKDGLERDSIRLAG
jgi:hypothetical protein